ncbi:transcriptional repressor [Candidatus Saccharibacteria bacterium]|nr:transcriptional repressor [Candidatus Saccharibacteria bacterium]
MSQLHQLLSANKLRTTVARQKVFSVLKTAQSPLSIQQLTTLCAPIDRTSVYRTLTLFNKLNIIQVITTGWKKRYELAGPFKPHHHHLQCDICQQLIALETPPLEKMIQHVANLNSYVLTSHHIELHGICQACYRAPNQRQRSNATACSTQQ